MLNLPLDLATRRRGPLHGWSGGGRWVRSVGRYVQSSHEKPDHPDLKNGDFPVFWQKPLQKPHMEWRKCSKIAIFDPFLRSKHGDF